MSDPLNDWIKTHHDELIELGFKIEVKKPQPEYEADATYVTLLAERGGVQIGCWGKKRFDFDVYSYIEDKYIFIDSELEFDSEYEVDKYFQSIFTKHIAPLLT